MSDAENSLPNAEVPKRRVSYLRWALYGIALIAAVAIAIPNYVKSRETACKNACINNLRQIDGAKEQWALEHKLEAGAPSDQEAIGRYIKGGWPTCPGGGSYTADPIGLAPRCSLGHTL